MMVFYLFRSFVLCGRTCDINGFPLCTVELHTGLCGQFHVDVFFSAVRTAPFRVEGRLFLISAAKDELSWCLLFFLQRPQMFNGRLEHATLLLLPPPRPLL